MNSNAWHSSAALPRMNKRYSSIFRVSSSPTNDTTNDVTKMASPSPPHQWRHLAAAAAALAVSAALLWSIKNHYKYLKNENDARKAEKKAGDGSKVMSNANRLDDSPRHGLYSSIKQHIPSHLQRELHKERRRQEKIPDLARKSPMYDNIKMTDPNGELLATISLQKARWYVCKQLAEWTELNTCIQLLFTPKAYSGGGYEKSIKKNVCVGCGSEEYHMRHYVVPYAYRTLLPKRYKTHLSHDVVILCPDCHLLCEHETQLRMKELQDLRPQECRNASFVDQNLQRVRSAALALLRWRDKLPLAKIDEYNTLICHYLKTSSDSGEELSSKQLQEAIDIDSRIPNPNYISGPKFVVRSLKSDDEKIEEFIKEWRRHFVDTLQPRFLPEGWSIDAPVTSNVLDSDDESENSTSK